MVTFYLKVMGDHHSNPRRCVALVAMRVWAETYLPGRGQNRAAPFRHPGNEYRICVFTHYLKPFILPKRNKVLCVVKRRALYQFGVIPSLPVMHAHVPA